MRQYNLGEPRNGHQFRYNRQLESTKYKLKLDLSYFDRLLTIEDFLYWFRNVENLFDYMNISETQQVKLIAYKLRGRASYGENGS